MRLSSVCPECGAVYERDDNTAACPTCQPRRTHRPNHYYAGSSTSRGYDSTWKRLSARARKLSPQCEDCGTVEDLTADHSAEAWKRRSAGKAIRLRDIAVVCRRCNSERGAARGNQRDQHARWIRPDLNVLAAELESEDDP